uniref:SFRICE_022719 n=1 Tax=Spodoptera frugiperda TaxID=7108 RepID=A0A2H1W7A3_SPOFR
MHLCSLPRWSSGRNCDCRTWGLGFDSRVGQCNTRLFSAFRKFLSTIARSLELCRLCPVDGNRLTPYYMELISQNGEKWLYTSHVTFKDNFLSHRDFIAHV